MTLEASVNATLDALRDQWRAQQPFTIFRVPAYVRESNREAYEPRAVSIGPYYHGGEALRAMEDHKWRYLHDLLSRCRLPGDDTPVVTASALVAEMRALESRARACYSERRLDLDSDDFIRMLLLDGCFILEYFFKWYTREPEALCDVGWNSLLVIADLRFMENQIPFFVLEKLYGTVAGAQGTRKDLLNLLVEHIGEEQEPITEPSVDWEIHHLLHLYYQCFVPKRPPPETTAPATAPAALTRNAVQARYKECFMPKRTPRPRQTTRTIPRATELLEAGVTFVLASTARDSYDVTFDRRRGVMKIPAIEIDDIKLPRLVNLMAFEQIQCEEPRLLNSYVALMSNLIVTVRDVELLRRLGILESLLADDEAAARFFSHLGDVGGIDYDTQLFAGLYEDVRRYCNSLRHRHRAALRRNYCTSPWTAISVVAAALALFLTAAQTYYTVFPKK